MRYPPVVTVYISDRDFDRIARGIPLAIRLSNELLVNLVYRTTKSLTKIRQDRAGETAWGR